MNHRYGYAKEFARQALLTELARIEQHFQERGKTVLAQIEQHNPRDKMEYADLCGLVDLVYASHPDNAMRPSP